MKFTAFLALLVSFSAWAQQKVATVKLVRGTATAEVTGKSQNLKLDDWVDEGAVIKTSDKSFVKLIFIDKSSMNVGPNSEMKIEKFDGKEAGVMDVVKGQIRSQVTKDYLQISDHDKSKLFIKTKNAVMGVRGTDFMITTNGINTSTVLFEGEVAFNSLPEQASGVANAKLDEIVDRGVKIHPGQFSVVQADIPQPTVPSVLNLQQRETLEKNVNLESSDRRPSNASSEPTKTVVPDGLSGDAVANKSDNLKSVMASTGSSGPEQTVKTADAAGFDSGDKIKPANGSFLHLTSGVIIPPPPGSVLDPNTNTYIPGPGNGTVAANGDYQPPADIVIKDSGEMFKVSGGGLQPIAAPLIVFSSGGPSLSGPAANTAPTISNFEAPKPREIVPTGEITRDLAPQINPIETSGQLNIDVIK